MTLHTTHVVMPRHSLRDLHLMDQALAELQLLP